MAFFTVSFKDILWVIESFNIFDNLFTTIYKSSKRKFLILENKDLLQKIKIISSVDNSYWTTGIV